VILFCASIVSFAAGKKQVIKGNFSGVVTDIATGKPLSGVTAIQNL